MRILHVNKFLYRRGGAEAYMLDLAAAQREAGHEVSFFAMEHPDNDADPNADLFPSRMELDPPPAGAAARAKVAAQIVYRRDARRGMEATLRRVRPDVVHLHNIYHQLSPSILRPIARHGVPALMTLHDYKLICPTYQLLDNGQICEACVGGHFTQAIRRRCNEGSLAGSTLSAVELGLHTLLGAYAPIDVFACPSRFLRDKMAQGKVFPERLEHLPNFCDLERTVPATEPGTGVLFAGRLSPEKGVDVLIAAAALMPSSIEVTIAGDGPERERLEKQAADLGVTDRVHFLGRVSGERVADEMRAAAVVTVPSRWHENQPMTVLEAYATGRPVVATDLGGLPELIVEGETGRTVPSDAPAALADALSALALNPPAAHAMGHRARASVAEHHSITSHTAALDELYRLAATRKEGALR